MSDPAALDFLRTRRSRPVRLLSAPVPDRDQLAELLTIAARVPDHGRLEPWRFVVLAQPALRRLADAVADYATAQGMAPEVAAKARSQYDESPLTVAVIGCPRPPDRIPAIEQILSAGNVCLSLLNAALAAGWGAAWMTGWAVHDRGFAGPAFGLADDEWVAGLIHIGTATRTPPERPRPDVAAITRWVDE